MKLRQERDYTTNSGHTQEESAVASHRRSEDAGKLDENWHVALGARQPSIAEQFILGLPVYRNRSAHKMVEE